MFDTLADNVKKTAKQVLDAGSKVWVNTIWGSLCGDHDDDRAYDSPEPDQVYLEKKGRRRF